jgi:hypothetical protein
MRLDEGYELVINSGVFGDCDIVAGIEINLAGLDTIDLGRRSRQFGVRVLGAFSGLLDRYCESGDLVTAGRGAGTHGVYLTGQFRQTFTPVRDRLRRSDHRTFRIGHGAFACLAALHGAGQYHLRGFEFSEQKGLPLGRSSGFGLQRGRVLPPGRFYPSLGK